jgi:hypothetical protein
MRWLALALILFLQPACTTLVNRRDLYSPEPGPDSREAMKQMAGTTTITTTRTEMRGTVSPREETPPEFH